MKKTIDEILAVMTAFKEGKKIECVQKGCGFSPYLYVEEPCWDWPNYDYRVKSEPKYRPYEDADEFLMAQKEHGMYLYFTSNCAYKLATGINKGSVAILWDIRQVEEIPYEALYRRAIWQDGTPCGILEE